MTEVRLFGTCLAEEFYPSAVDAATRVLRRPAPELRPELVAPGVAFLASSACMTSGAVLNAAGGRFSAARWDRSDSLDLGPTPASPEDIAIRWQQIAGS